MDSSAVTKRSTAIPDISSSMEIVSPQATPESVSKNAQILKSVCKDFQHSSTNLPGLGVQELSKHHCWGTIYSNVDQAALHDAHQKMSILVSLCAKKDIVLHPRKEKTLTRIQEKHAIAQTSREKVGFIDDFKVVSDFMAGRVHCRVADIATVVDKLKQLASDSDGWCVVRGEGSDSYGAHKKDGTFKDIVQYAFMYLPELGHVAEFQVGHEMASVTFTIDSFLRDQKKYVGEAALPLSLWGDKDKGTQLYGAVKEYLLLQANQPSATDLAQKKQECKIVAERLFAGVSMPIEVRDVLNSL
jgi:hypothetical protein